MKFLTRSIVVEPAGMMGWACRPPYAKRLSEPASIMKPMQRR